MKVPSWSALEGEEQADVCVLGAGLTGCAAALELARAGRKVIVLEAGTVASGASGRNLGHIASGLGCHYKAAVQQMGREGAREVWSTHRENHARVRELTAEIGTSCGYVSRGGFRLALTREEALDLADSEDLLREDGFPGEFLDHYMLESRFSVSGFSAGYWAADDAEIDSAAFVRAVAHAAGQRGARIFEQSAVRRMEYGGRGVTAHTDRGSVRAPLAIVALNAFVSPLVPFLAERVRPLRGQCVALGHSGDLELPSPAYADHGRVYWRRQADRLMIGGFDDLALEEESTTQLGTTPLLQGAIQEFAQRHLGASPRVLARWSGIMGISVDGFPFVGPIPDLPLVAAAGFTGLGYGYALLAARWACEYATRGRDVVPARYRAGRPLEERPWPPWAPPS